MMSLAQQITSASRHAQREAIRIATEARLKAERQAEIRAKQWASRKAGGNGVDDALIKCLPTGKEAAIPLAQIKVLLRNMDVRESSITSALTKLVKDRSIARTGERRNYRYYVAEGKKP